MVKEGLPGPGLLDTVERARADLTVLGPHGSSRLMRFLLGSVSEMLLNETSGSILIVRGRPQGRQSRGMRVVLAMDFSTDAKCAAGFLSTLCLPRASRIMLLHVEEHADRVLAHISGMGRIDLSQAVEQAMRARKRWTLLMLERMGRRFPQQGLAVDHVFADGAPAEEILRAADRHRADLIVMGSEGLTGLDRYLLGSVSRKVARVHPVRCSWSGTEDDERRVGRAQAMLRTLLDKLEPNVVPCFCKARDRFIKIIRYTITVNGSFFNTHRMVAQYMNDAYSVLDSYFGKVVTV